MSQEQRGKKKLKPNHKIPGKFWLDYILLPYGEFYEKTRVFLEAERGDTMRFFDGPDVTIERVVLIEDAVICEMLSRIRYGISWDKAFQIWLRYARLEGHGRDILCEGKCLLVVYNGID